MRRSLNEVIKLNEKQKKQLADEIRAVYNKALDDAMRWLKEQAENIETDYYLLYRDVQ